MAGDPAALHDQPDETPGRSIRRDLLERRATDEVVRFGELDDASEPGFVGVRLEVQLVAVERHPGLQPEGVASAESDRTATGGADRLEQCVPQLGRGGRLHEDLEPVLARVARPRDERWDAGDRSLRRGVVAQRRQVDIGQRPEDLGGQRALDSQQSGRERAIVEDGLEPFEPGGECVGHDRRVARVGDDQEALLAEPVDDEVVDDPAVGGADHRVLGATDGQGGRIRDQRRGEGQAGLRAVDVELAHVRQVEQADSLADRPMLVDDRAVLDRHQPATEFDQPRTEVAVGIGQGGEVDRRLEGVGHEAASVRAVSDPAPGCAISWAARATRARSVSKVSIVGAWSKGIQRTSSNS